jgi:hypothetical protein
MINGIFVGHLSTKVVNSVRSRNENLVLAYSHIPVDRTIHGSVQPEN